MNELILALTEARKLERNIGSIDKLVTTLKQFEKSLATISPEQKVYLADVMYDDLVRLKFQLKSIKGNGQVTSLHDKIFKNLLGWDSRKTPHGITLLFEEFIKGITYFRKQVDPSNPVPIYHRFMACGNGSEEFRNNNNICLQGMSRAERKERKALIKRCYIERLVYNEMYKHESLHFPLVGTNAFSQDEGHVFRIGMTLTDFQTCFKDQDFKVSLEWDSMYPVKLTIDQLIKNKLVSSEVYYKELANLDSRFKVYRTTVDCKKTNEQGGIYEKVQTFEFESGWSGVGSHATNV